MGGLYKNKNITSRTNRFKKTYLKKYLKKKKKIQTCFFGLKGRKKKSIPMTCFFSHKQGDS